MSGNNYRHLLVTGPPGVGKTTIIKDLVTKLQQRQIPCFGFFTEEMRENGVRIGFDVVPVDERNKRRRLAYLGGSTKGPSVGRYTVDVESFESVIRSVFLKVHGAKEPNVLFLDEIGNMECLSQYFQNTVHKMFQKQEKSVLVATIPVRHNLTVVRQIVQLPNIELISVNVGNRDFLSDELSRIITTSYKSLKKM